MRFWGLKERAEVGSRKAALAAAEAGCFGIVYVWLHQMKTWSGACWGQQGASFTDFITQSGALSFPLPALKRLLNFSV